MEEPFVLSKNQTGMVITLSMVLVPPPPIELTTSGLRPAGLRRRRPRVAPSTHGLLLCVLAVVACQTLGEVACKTLGEPNPNLGQRRSVCAVQGVALCCVGLRAAQKHVTQLKGYKKTVRL